MVTGCGKSCHGGLAGEGGTRFAEMRPQLSSSFSQRRTRGDQRVLSFTERGHGRRGWRRGMYTSEMRKLTRGIYNYDPSVARYELASHICIPESPAARVTILDGQKPRFCGIKLIENTLCPSTARKPG